MNRGLLESARSLAGPAPPHPTLVRKLQKERLSVGWQSAPLRGTSDVIITAADSLAPSAGI